MFHEIVRFLCLGQYLMIVQSNHIAFAIGLLKGQYREIKIG
jgi:hypothetical protein